MFITRGNENCSHPSFNLKSRALDKTDFSLAMGLALAAAIIMFPGLSVQSLANWDEAIYAVVTRELLARPGMTLYYGASPWFEKPPFLFWLMAGTSLIFGLTEFALRLPTALFGIGAVVLEYFVGRRLGGRIAGVMAAVLLLGVPQFVAYSRLAMMDVPLLTLGMLSIFLIIYGDKQTSTTVLAGAALGLAALTKSVAALLFLPGLVAITVALRGLRGLWSREILLGVAVALAIALPWHVWSTITYGRSFLDQYVFFHMVDRFLRPLEGHNGNPFYYFDLYWYNAGLLGLVHGAGIALGLVLAILQRDRSLGAVVILALGAFMMVNAQGTKIGWYLTPVYPAAALAAALTITRLVSSGSGRFAAVVLATVFAIPAIISGRSVFAQHYNILDYSPEVRSLRSVQPFVQKRVPVLYTVAVSAPAPRFYLADHVESIDQVGLERLLAANRSFLCLSFKPTAREFLNRHPQANLEIVASTESLAVIAHR